MAGQQQLAHWGSLAGVLLGVCLCSLGTAHADTAALVQTSCTACHGEGGNSAVPLFPKLAGLQASYIEKQMRDFLSGLRKNEVMTPALAGLTASDIPGLAAHYAAQKPLPGQSQDPAVAAKGKAMYDDGNTATGVPACQGCHQPAAEGNERYPRLAGQHQTYTTAQLRKFKSGERNNDKAKVMRAVAARMSEEEIDAVADYLAGLP